MRKLSNTEAELKKALLKSVYFVGTSNDLPIEVGAKTFLICFLFSYEFRVVLA